MSSNKNISPYDLKNYYLNRKYPNGWLFTLLPTLKVNENLPLTVFIDIYDLHKYGYNIRSGSPPITPKNYTSEDTKPILVPDGKKISKNNDLSGKYSSSAP